MCIVNYVTQSSTKHAIAQNAFENRNQAFSRSKIIVEPNNLESLFANTKSNLHKKSIKTESLSDIASDISIIYSSKVMKKASCKCKWSINESNAAKK